MKYKQTLTGLAQEWMLRQPLAEVCQRLGALSFVFAELGFRHIDKFLVHSSTDSRLHWIEAHKQLKT